MRCGTRRTKSRVRLRSADVLGRTRFGAARFAALAVALTLTAASAALAAAGTSERSRTRAPGKTAQRLGSRTHQALLGLYALDSKLHAWRGRVASLGAEAATLRRRNVDLRRELEATAAELAAGQRQLALDLRALYERGDVDPVAVVLGAGSLTKGLRQLDALSQVANESRRVVAATSAAHRRLLLSRRRLAGQEHRLARSLAAARRAERNLTAAVASRLAYVSSLRARAFPAPQVQSVVAAAHAAQQKSQHLQPTASPPAKGGRQLVVSATCYDLPGRTATGMPVGRGVVAVDPSVIPLGTRMHIPGYGDGVAADVGSGVKGRIIDLWFPTYSECAAWGRRTVTITIY
jgi:3D (Asp-Asp-Asp) domain-containing protein